MVKVWEISCLFGLWGWVLCVVIFILKSFPCRGVFRGRAALPWGIATALFFALWLFGMSRA